MSEKQTLNEMVGSRPGATPGAMRFGGLNSMGFLAKTLNDHLESKKQPEKPKKKKKRSEKPFIENGVPVYDETGEFNDDGYIVPGESPIARLAREVQEAENSLIEQVTKAGGADMSKLQYLYAQQLLMSMARPLAEGISMNSVFRVVGMYAAAAVFSPQMMDIIGDSKQDVNKVWYKGRLKAMEVRTDLMESKISDLRRRRVHAGPITKTKMDREIDTLSERVENLNERADDLKRQIKIREEGREPYTPRSAALIQVGLDKNFYNAIREEGADIGELRKDYEAAKVELYENAYGDGVSAKSISAAHRRVVGEYMGSNPQIAAVYEETGFGDWSRTSRVERSRTTEPSTSNPDGIIKELYWDGEFEDRFGNVSKDGSFSVRMPMDEDEHLAAMELSMASDLLLAQDADDFNDRLQTMHAAWSDHVHAAEAYRQGKDYDYSSYEGYEESNQIYGKSMTMAVSLLEDGRDPSELARSYSYAMGLALNDVVDSNVDLMAQWNAKYGASWDVSSNSTPLHWAMVVRETDPRYSTPKVDKMRGRYEKENDEPNFKKLKKDEEKHEEVEVDMDEYPSMDDYQEFDDTDLEIDY